MQEPIKVANFRTKLEAEAAASLLSNEDIPYLIQSQEGMMHGPIGPGATLYVAARDAEQARQILADAGAG